MENLTGLYDASANGLLGKYNLFLYREGRVEKPPRTWPDTKAIDGTVGRSILNSEGDLCSIRPQIPFRRL